MKKITTTLFLVFALSLSLRAQSVDCKTYTYTHRGDVALQMDVYKNSSEVQPCLVYVFGGAFLAGSRNGEGLSEDRKSVG